MRNILLFILLSVSLGCSGKQPYLSKQDSNQKWNLVWSEDFDDPQTIDDNWKAENAAPSHILSSRWRENVSVHDGYLFLNNRKETREGKDWTSASITRKSSVHYGYMECRMKISASTGVNNSFWLYNWSREGHHAFEIDIVESHYPNIIRTNVHDNGTKAKKTNIQYSKKISNEKNLSEDFHVYGFEWSEKYMKYYFDGKLVRTEKNKVCVASARMVLGTAVMKWAGEVTDSIDGTSMVVDWVRYYTKK